MATILAFAGSNSSTSVNFKLVKHTASLIVGHDVQVLNMANFPFPIYSEDYEKENGFSNSLIGLKNDIGKADALIISVNEHNSNPSAFFKNVLDWLSRLERGFITGTKVFLLSTSPGKRGAIGAHEVVKNILSRFGAEITASFSLPSFYDNFDAEHGIQDPELSKSYQDALTHFLAEI